MQADVTDGGELEGCPLHSLAVESGIAALRDIPVKGRSGRNQRFRWPAEADPGKITPAPNPGAYLDNRPQVSLTGKTSVNLRRPVYFYA